MNVLFANMSLFTLMCLGRIWVHMYIILQVIILVYVHQKYTEANDQ